MKMCKQLIRWTDIQCMFYPQPFYKYKYPLPCPPPFSNPSPMISILLLFSRDKIGAKLIFSLIEYTCPYCPISRCSFQIVCAVSLYFSSLFSCMQQHRVNEFPNEPRSSRPSRYLAAKLSFCVQRKKKERKEKMKKIVSGRPEKGNLKQSQKVNPRRQKRTTPTYTCIHVCTLHRSSQKYPFPTRSHPLKASEYFSNRLFSEPFYPMARSSIGRITEFLDKPTHDSCSHRIRENSVIFTIYVLSL